MRSAPALLLLLAACSPADTPGSFAAAEALERMDLRERIAQLVVVGLPEDSAPASPRLREWAVQGRIGGVLLREGSAAEVNGLRSAAGVPLLVAAEVDVGVGERLPGGTVFPPAAELAAFAPEQDVRSAAAAVAREARASGIHLGLVRAPPLNAGEPLALTALNPARTAAGLAAWVAAAEEEGLAVSVRGLWMEDPAPPPLDWDRARLAAIDLRMLRAAMRGEATAIEVGAARLPSVTGDTLPLPFSSAAIAGLLRRDLGWRGLVAVDLGAGSPPVRSVGAGEAAVRALAAGADLLLGLEDPDSVVSAVVVAVERGRLSRDQIDASTRRVLELKSRFADGGDAADRPDPSETAALAARLAGVVRQGRESRERIPPAPVLRPAEPSEVGMDAAALARADRVIEQAIADSVFSGAALAVARRGGLVRLRGYGRTAPGAGAPPVSAESTLFDLASLSKVVGTTTAVALLVDAGRMRLGAPLEQFLPGFRGEGKEEVTVRHVLTHTSGLPSGLWLFGSAETPRGAIRQVLRQPLRRSPGEEVEYSDLGMILLAEAAESAAGMPLDRFLAHRVFAPLGMASTMYLPPAALRERIVPTATVNERSLVLRGVVHDANAFRLGGVAGHAGIFSTARDVAVFAQTMLNRGAYGPVQVLSPEVATAFTRRQPGAGDRALGWDTPAERSSAGRFFSARSFGHTGFTGTSLWIDPELELFVVLLTNRTFTEASSGEMFGVRVDVHEAVARAVDDQPVRRRAGAR